MDIPKKENPYINILLWTLLIILAVFIFSKKMYGQSKEEVYKELMKQEVQHPEIVMAQILYETRHLKSNICKVNHNLFGMKLPHQRQTTAIGEDSNTFAIYRNWKESIADYLIWQTKYYKGGDYYQFIKDSGYCPSEDYVPTLKRIKI